MERENRDPNAACEPPVRLARWRDVRSSGLLAHGSSAFGLLPKRPTLFQDPMTFSGCVPEASPLTVAGAARDFHPLPSTSVV